MAIPDFGELFNPLLKAMHDLGGSASLREMEERVADILQLLPEDAQVMHKGNTTEVNYRLAWARNYLKRYGILENSSRGVWALTAKGQDTLSLNPDDVKKVVRSLDTDKKSIEVEEHEQDWQIELLEILKKMSPDAFQRLCQRLLRESGFVQVEVTGQSGDGGIDGHGIIRLGGLIGFKVIFQCKRYTKTVGSQDIREFQGTMMGRSEHGLFLTTGTFTRDARLEAGRPGAAPIDLIDGEDLVLKLKELKLGVTGENTVIVDEEWFKNF